MSSTLRSSSAVLANGVELPYLEQGDPNGIPVLLLHGYSDSMRSYEPLLAHLPDRLHVFVPTLRGHGDASRPEQGYRFPDFADDIALFLDAQGIERAVVAGSSMGSSVAQQLAIAHAGRLLGLVLMASFVNYRDNPEAAGLVAVVEPLEDPVDEGFIREFQQATLAQPVPEAFFEMIVAESRKLPVRVWKLALEGMLESDVTDELARFPVPTLVMWGDRDVFSRREEQELLATRIPNARLSIYEGAGHAFHWEEPARVAAEITAFVDGIAR